MSYEVIIPLFVLIFIQAYYIEGYLRGYAYKFFSGENLSWNPKHDRMALWGSLIFFITSLLLLSEIFYYKTDDYDSIWPYYDYYAPYVYIVMIFFFTSFIYYIIKTTNKIKNKEAVEKAAKEEKNVNNNITIDKLYSKEIITAKEEKKKLNAQYDNRKGMDDVIVRKMYDLLLQYQYISDDMKWEEFFQKFLREPIVLDMGVPSFRYFYNLLFDKFKIRRIKHKEFVSLFIKKLDNSPYDVEQFRKEKNPSPKDRHVLDEIFNKIMS